MPNLEMIPFVFLLCHNPLFFCCDFQSSEENKTDSLSLSLEEQAEQTGQSSGGVPTQDTWGKKIDLLNIYSNI